jgi:hypothetical protein
VEGLPFLLFAAFGVIALVFAYLGWKQEQARTQALGELAARLGFSFAPGKDESHDDRFAQFEIFRRGHSRVAINTLHGSVSMFGADCRVVMGDFRYKVTSSNGKSSSTRTYTFSYVIVRLPWRTPALLIRPEGIFDKVAAAFGFDDIDFESAEFSRKFLVKSDDKRFAYDVLHPRMMEMLLATKPPMIDIELGALCFSDGSRRWEPSEFERKLAYMGRFAELWPRHLLTDLGTG